MIAQGERSNRIASRVGNEHGIRSSNTAGHSDTNELSEIHELFESAKDSITSLMKVSILIRDATPRDRYAKAETATKEPFLDYFDIAHVGHKFPKVEHTRWLQERLGKAITKRRRYLQYCRTHHGQFSEGPQPEDLGVKSSANIKDISYPGLEADPQADAQTTTARSDPVTTLTRTVASTLRLSHLEPEEAVVDSRSMTSYASSIAEDQSGVKIQVPHIEEITNINPFECPYCWTLQDISTEKSWR